MSPVSSADNVFYASNSIGMKLHNIIESERSNYEWVLERTVDSELLNESLYYNGAEIWSTESISQDQGRSITKLYSDGLIYTSKYRDNLLVEERWESIDEQIRSVKYQYFTGELLQKTEYEGEILSETTNYVRKSDGSLHLRQTKYHISNFSEILIIGSNTNVSKTALGRKGDFSVIKSFQNGIQITENWISGTKVSNDQEVQPSESGELIISEKSPEGDNITSYYAENGNLDQQIIEKEGTTETILNSYDSDNKLLSKTIIVQDSKTVIEYTYSIDGLPESESTYKDGSLIKIITFLKTGNREDIFKEGSLYLIITYEEDGQTIKDSKLAGE